MTESLVQIRERTRTLLQLRRYEEAAQSARSGLASQPNDPDLTVLLAIALTSAGEREALPVAKRAVSLQPEDPLAHRTLGWILFQRGKGANNALKHLDRALALAPHDAVSHVMKGEVYLHMAELVAGASRRRRDRFAAQADEQAAEAVRLNPDAASGYLVRSRARLIRHDADGAERWARQALSLEPNSALGHQALGLAAQLRGAPDDAADHLLSAGQLDPRSRAPIRLMRGLRSGRASYIGGRAYHADAKRRRIEAALMFVAVIAIPAGFALGPLPGLASSTIAIGFLLNRAIAPRRAARRAMSDQAHGALERDRELRGRLGRLRR